MATKVVVNRQGVSELLKVTVAPLLKEIADDIDAAAGPGFEVNTEVGPNRARAEVRTATLEARLAEAKDRALTRAIDAGRR